ncbi:MAG: hypothetical protein D3925_02685 [Candidatus Electrothrix sp. AR5]|nr:hypothetical protein [Candidatus Electrothrix sp. AR5]
MRAWTHRPPELAALLNPAFCSFLVSTGLDEYIKKTENGAPYPFPFIMLPLVLHKSTRRMFPKTSRTTFSAWITKPDTVTLKIGFAERARNLTPYVKEALVFAIQEERIQISNSGMLKPVSPSRKSFSKATPEVNECIRAARMCGKWFSSVGDFNMTMALLGVSP